VKEVQQVSKNLGTIVFHMSEFLAFLKNYPPRYRQPYFMHLMIGLSMFGRQMEMERVMNFLMQTTEPASTGESIGVLPIVGSAGVGKNTLVAHVLKIKVKAEQQMAEDSS
jgi:Cdc6-like AAA superfamily ATPase